MVVKFVLGHCHIGLVKAHEQVPKSLQPNGHTGRDPGQGEGEHVTLWQSEQAGWSGRLNATRVLGGIFGLLLAASGTEETSEAAASA